MDSCDECATHYSDIPTAARAWWPHLIEPPALNDWYLSGLWRQKHPAYAVITKFNAPLDANSPMVFLILQEAYRLALFNPASASTAHVALGIFIACAAVASWVKDDYTSGGYSCGVRHGRRRSRDRVQRAIKALLVTAYRIEGRGTISPSVDPFVARLPVLAKHMNWLRESALFV